MPKRNFTTFEVAKFCDVEPATVAYWVEKGLLPAFKTPGGHRRVSPIHLTEFMETHGMPIPPALMRQRDKYKILIVDDEELILDLLSKAFSKYQNKFEIKTASSGFEAGVLVASFSPDLVLLDLKMPGIDGFEICKRIKSTPETRKTKVIVMTGYYPISDVDRNLSSGIEFCIKKPFKTNEVIEKVCEVLGIDFGNIAVSK